MTCGVHSWWFDTPCPQCAAAAVTAPVTISAPEPLLPVGLTETPEPNFQTAPDGHPPADFAGPEPEKSGPEVIFALPEPALEDVRDTTIPNFLIRNPDNSLRHPEPWGPLTVFDPSSVAAPVIEDARTLADAVLTERLYDPSLSVSARQPYIMEATRRENKKKAYQRLDKMHEAKSKKGTADQPE